MIPYGHQSISQADIDAVLEVLKSDFLTQGPQVPLFETSVSNYCGAKHAVAANSATSALHISCLALGIQPGDSVWTSPITFVASANCARYCGADIDFVDIDPSTFNLSPELLEEKLINAKAKGTLPKALVVVHLCGQSCDMEQISRLAKHYGIRVIEDASHALGGRYNGKPVGSCEFSDITVFSFHPVKIITTGEGGMAVTNNSELAEKMRLYRSHGITRDPELMSPTTHEAWYYEQLSLGYNYRMSDLHAALGVSQLTKLDGFIARRLEIAQQYSNELSNLPIKLPKVIAGCLSAFHLYVIRLPSESRAHVYSQLKEKNIACNVHYIPVHLQPYYRALGFNRGDYPNAESYYTEALSLPIFPDLTPEQQQHITTSLEQILL